MNRVAFLVVLGAIVIARAAMPAKSDSPVVISEFLAANANGLRDENGDNEDWIELHNRSTSPVNLAGWRITDKANHSGAWVFPEVTIQPGAYLVVFASGKNRRNPGSNLHLDFSLSADGEYLALIEPDGETIASEFRPSFPPQTADVSYGVGSDGTLQYFSPPTPRSANGTGFPDRAGEPRFSVERGFFTAPFDLVITTPSVGAVLRYTTNGAPPTASTGQVVSGPIRIAGTTVIRAAAFRDGWLPSAVITHTYLFLEDVIRQSPTGSPPPGWPSSWGGNVRDYGMDPDIVNDARYRDAIIPALMALPSFCVTVDLPDLFDPQRGIYANPGQDGRSWERPISLELLRTDGVEGFQANAGIRIRGGYSRSGNNPKHAFRFFFRQEYGVGRLEYPVFGEDATDSFDSFDLRTFQNYSWSFEGDSRGTFIRDVFNRDLQRAMGHNSERGNYYHLYINGQYWGIYNSCERPEASYAESYYGGDKEEYDVIKVEAGPYVVQATDGNMAGWTQLYELVRNSVDDTLFRRLMGQDPDGARNPEYPVYLDPVNLIDYMLIILYGGNLDAPISNFLGNTSPNNFYGIWNRARADRGFQFFIHDAEHTLLDLNADRTGPFPAGDSSVTKSNPQWLWQKLMGSQEFRILVADRIQRHFFNGGPLTTEGARAIYTRRQQELDPAIVAESARWGDSKRATNPLRKEDWVAAVNQNLNFISRRTQIVLNQLRADGLYPSVAAPQFNQPGGPINSGFALLIAPTTGTVYYTLDGTDPRRPGGAVSTAARVYSEPVALLESGTVKARTLQNGVWSALTEAEFVVIQTFTEVLISEIHYHPPDVGGEDGDIHEFIELKNVSSRPLDFSGVRFTAGIEFVFPNGYRLPPGAFAVLASDREAFERRYPGVPLAGVYTGRLSNSGERVELSHATGDPIVSVTYGTRSPWPRSADGEGFSLVSALPNQNPDPNNAANWRASSRAGGSPGADDPLPDIVPVIVNEVLANAEAPDLDAVELFNPNDAPAPIGGWYLSDDRRAPKKFRIPEGTVIPAGGYLVFDASDFNATPDDPAGFGFSSLGDDVWLFSADAAGELTGYSDGFSFPASARGASFGRHTNSVGVVSHPPQIQSTLGGPNLGPRVGPVVINEIHYRPSAGDAEFIEIRNISDAAVPLHDPQAPTNTWRLAGVEFDFPEGVVLPPGGFAVITAGDPGRFRERWSPPESAQVFGPFGGTLQDAGEWVALEQPDTPVSGEDGTLVIPRIVVDAVSYGTSAPWPSAANGLGASLERLSPAQFGDDPASWRASPGEPSPGADNDGNRPPYVSAGADMEIEATRFPVEVELHGSGSDDGLPANPGRLAFAWEQVSGPGRAWFVDATKSNAVVQLPGTGAFTFRLTANDGERSRTDDVIITARRPSEAQTLVDAGAVWKYLDTGANPGAGWNTLDFNDAAWPSGRAELGFGDGDEQTTLRRTGAGGFITTFYFRRVFDVPDPAAVTALNIALVRDDGALVYLNGNLVFRSNMPEGPVNASTPASEVVGGADESAFHHQAVDPALLRSGTNLLAVEVHQQNANSTDLSFNLRLDAAVTSANRAPLVDAGQDRVAPVGVAVALEGSFEDDGLPSPPGVPEFRWSQVEGPGEAEFADAESPRTLVTLPALGRYILRLTANDGAMSASDEVTLDAQGDDYAAWRESHFTAAELADPAISGDDADPDGDGQRNRDEFLSGTDPRDASSVLGIAAGVLPDGRIRLAVPAVTGRTYTVLQRELGGGSEWVPLEHIGAAECDCEIEVILPPPAGDAARLFRVVTPSVP